MNPIVLLFLAWLLVLLPMAAIKSARRMKEAREGASARPLPPREAIWKGSLLMLVFMGALAWAAARTVHVPLFRAPQAAPWLVATLSVAALGACLVLRAISRALRSPEELRRMAVFALAPRTRREWVFWSGTVLAASVAEEMAYRGIGVVVLEHALGSRPLAILVSATAFAVSHALQGWKSGAVIFGIAGAMHALVESTGSLLPAMVVHAVYDILAGRRIAREAAKFDEETRSAASDSEAPVTP